jgi:hypothetical protein
MKKLAVYILDVGKCILASIICSIIIGAFAGIISLLVYGFNGLLIMEGIKKGLYYTGMLGLLLSAGFFMQRDATRPLAYNIEWKKYFEKLNLGFVIMFVSLFTCSIGMLIQNYLEKVTG